MSLPREDYAMLTDLAGALGVSRAELLRELVESARPVWSVLLDAARTTLSAPQAQREAMARLADDLGARIVQAEQAAKDFAAYLTEHGDQQGDQDGPPPSNTGVRNP